MHAPNLIGPCDTIVLRNEHHFIPNIQVTDTPCSSTVSRITKEIRESDVRERINMHLLKLTMVREQAGLISSPSNEFLKAEKKFAEVCTFILIKALWCRCLVQRHNVFLLQDNRAQYTAARSSHQYTHGQYLGYCTLYTFKVSKTNTLTSFAHAP